MSRNLHEMNHVVYSGWMIKSPPERKLTGPWKIFRARWKRRYFVLSKPAQSLPGSYLLNYFSDENCRRLKGYIDLEQCSEIIESLDSEQFTFLLAIKTTHRGRERKYFLATDTEEQMSTWVRTLCSVCGLKADDTDATPEPARPQPQTEQPHAPVPASVAAQGIMTRPNLNTNSNLSPPSAHTLPQNSSPSTISSHRQNTTPHRTQNKNKPRPTTPSEYIQLDTCTSGSSVKRTGRQVSVDSVPEDFAPAPPVKIGPHDFTNDVFHHSDTTYDVPPPSNALSEDDVYKVPPPRPSRDALETYDYPPTNPSPGTPRSSSSESQKADSAYSSQSMYDTPPSRTDMTSLSKDEIYDIPPPHADDDDHSKGDEPPSRPPKPECLSTNVSQEPYMNLPPTSKVFSEKRLDINSVVTLPTTGMTQMSLEEMYDIPRSGAMDSNQNIKNTDTRDNGLSATVPPPSKCVPKEHKYMNAYGGVVGPGDQDVYLDMDPMSSVPVPPVGPRHSSSTDNEMEYTDMSGRSEFNDSFEGKPLYDYPPSSSQAAAAQGASPPPIPTRPKASEKLSVVDNKQDAYSIFSTARTKSFKKKGDNLSPLVQKKKTPTKPSEHSTLYSRVQEKVPLPLNLNKHPDYSTSDEDDEEMGTPNVWVTKPPAPSSKDTELKYVDLDHDESLEKEPVRSPHATTTTAQPTEYHQIDFVKTDALRNVKETVSVERNKKCNDT